MRTFDSISKEDITHDKEINVAAMRRDDDNRSIVLVVAFYFSNIRFVDYYLFINIAEQLMQKPSKHAYRPHRVIAKHLHTQLLSYFS